MARFSRLRRSAGLLLLATGFCGLSTGSAWSCIGAQESAQPDIVTASKSVAVDAYISGFKAMVGTAATQDYGSRPTMINGTTLAQVILQKHAATGKRFQGYDLSWKEKPTAEIVCAAITQACCDSAKEKSLEILSLKFLATEQIEAAALAHCREIALNTELCGSTIATIFSKEPLVNQGTNIQLPTFAFTTVTSTVSVPDGGTIVNGGKLYSLVPQVRQHIGADGLERIGIDFDITPRIIISEEEEELLLGTETEALEIEIRPLVEPGLLALNDAAPQENPAEDFVQLLPSGDDAPAENPELETSAARVVSPTMSPEEYLAAFSHSIQVPSDASSQVVPVAHEEPVTPTPAEAHAFDGPAQITLHDAPNTSGQGFVWQAQPARAESLDDLAARLEREFLARAVSGQLDVPAACPACDKEAACQAAAAGKSGQCQMDKCQAGQCDPLACPGCPDGSSCGVSCTTPSGALNAAIPGFTPRSQWTLPTPAITINPYAAGPGARTVLPQDADFFFRSPMEVPTGPSICGPQVYPGPSTFAPVSPQVALGPQHPRMVYPDPKMCPAPSFTATPAPSYGATPASSKTPVSGEALETHREISRTLEQLAERCESQGLYSQADELRTQAQDFRMRARVIHGHLSALPLPQPVVYGPLPGSYPVPATYYPEPAPSLAPSVAPAMYPQPQHQPLPLAQPMMVPRF